MHLSGPRDCELPITTYALFTCDEWKSKDSMRLIGIVSDFGKVYLAARELLENGIIEFADDRKMEDLDDMNLYDMLTLLNYFHIEEVPFNDVCVSGDYFV